MSETCVIETSAFKTDEIEVDYIEAWINKSEFAELALSEQEKVELSFTKPKMKIEYSREQLIDADRCLQAPQG